MRTWGASGISGRAACDAEVAGQERGELGGAVREDLVGRRTPFGVEARQPARDIGQRVPDAREVPIDQDGAAVADAEVVAPHVEMHQRVTVERGDLGGEPEDGQGGVEPRARAEPEREERLGIVLDLDPALEVELAVGGAREIRRRRRRGHLRQAGEHGVHVFHRPRGRPMGVGEILERDHRALAVVVPTEHARQERRAARLRVEHVLVADPRRRVVPARAFHERAPAVRQTRPASAPRWSARDG